MVPPVRTSRTYPSAQPSNTNPPMLKKLPNGRPPPNARPATPIEEAASPARPSPDNSNRPMVQQWLTGLNKQDNGDSPPRGPPVTRPMLKPARLWEALNEVSFRLIVPKSWGTIDIYRLFKDYGDVSRAQVFESRGASLYKDARVNFKPPIRDGSLQRTEFDISLEKGHNLTVQCTYDSTSGEAGSNTLVSRPGLTRSYQEETRVGVQQIDFGTLRGDQTMVVMKSCNERPSIFSPPSMTLNLRRRNVELLFGIPLRKTRDDGDFATVLEPIRIEIPLTEIRRALGFRTPDGTTSLILCVESPPFVSHRTKNTDATHRGNIWYDDMTWQRVTDVEHDRLGSQKPIKLVNPTAVIDVGRWLAYKVDLSEDTVASRPYKDLREAFEEYNIKVEAVDDMVMERKTAFDVWSWLDEPVESPVNAFSSLSVLHLLADGSSQLEWAVRYQLEACLSQGVIHEANVSGPEFMQQLTNMEATQAIKLLENAVDRKERHSNPMHLLRPRLLFGKPTKQKQIPRHCTRVRSATLTPTTIYINSPSLETSNRVIRKYREHEDRFLRVKFTDERYRGSVNGADDHSMDEIYARIKRAMQQGIDIGDRHYEFLAFGNSQFRERGAYFFSPTATLNAADMRAWMGNFTKINVVAKYCSRVGQCFSTTRPINSGSVKVEYIPDNERNGFCFTDGVGKISPFLAQLIAEEFNIPDPNVNYPSVFQFRLAGFKGVLAVDPSIKGGPIAQFRPSQNKFPAQYLGLEIIRFSQHSTAFLNQQLILVLTALGVNGAVFLKKMKSQISDIEKAMHDRDLALTLLQKTIDFNQTTLSLASIVYDGFMEAQDPFLISCLRLWKSWLLKGLKEKAKIFIDDGAFVLGCTDETGTLQGHFHANIGKVMEPLELPQIFLQVPTTENRNVYKVVTGICAIARNPSLHPGDIRVVLAVDVPALHHLKNCVVLPQTGDRDLANMCSGGDLDGDDYLVMWDNTMMPREWDHAPMDYSAPEPVVADGPVTVTDMTNFFVNHLKNDNLARIATAHRYWADRSVEGVKDDKCIALAHLHSMAVDYAKSGVPAIMDKALRTQMWPHWAENTHVDGRKVYHSRSILGQLYDTVQRAAFVPAWDLPFDKRVIDTYKDDFTEQILADAREVKRSYDESVQRVMAQYAVQTEFEIWTAFVLDHSQDVGDYKFAETLGEIFDGIRRQHVEFCCEKAGTTVKKREWGRLGVFVAACYAVTAEEVGVALEETKRTKVVGGRNVPVREKKAESMPFISFPWIFARELGIITRQGKGGGLEAELKVQTGVAAMKGQLRGQREKQKVYDLLGPDFRLEELPVVKMGDEVYQGGDMIDLLGDEEKGKETKEAEVVVKTPKDSPMVASPSGESDKGAFEQPSVNDDQVADPLEMNVVAEESLEDKTIEAAPVVQSDAPTENVKETENLPVAGDGRIEAEEEDDEEAGEEVDIDFGIRQSGFAKLAAITANGNSA